MARLGSTRTARAREMRRVLARWERSGLTLRAFAQREGMTPGTLGWWRHVFVQQGAPQRRTRARRADHPVPTTPVARSVPSPRPSAVDHFLEVRPATGAAAAWAPAVVEVLLRSGHVLRVPGGVAREMLCDIVAALERAC